MKNVHTGYDTLQISGKPQMNIHVSVAMGRKTANSQTNPDCITTKTVMVSIQPSVK